MIKDANGLDPAQAAFERFWVMWPDNGQRVARARAWRVWRRHNLGREADVLLAYLSAHTAQAAGLLPWQYLTQGKWRASHMTQR